MDNRKHDDFCELVRKHAPEAPPLPGHFREDVWRAIRSGQDDAARTGSPSAGILPAPSRLGFLLAGGFAAVVLSGTLGLWMGSSSLPDRHGNLFPTITSPPELRLPARRHS